MPTTMHSRALPSQPRFDFLAGGGEMGERMRAGDWAATPLGPPERWPAALKTTLRLMLTSNSPMFIFWGNDLIMFYNDAVIPLIGSERHPHALGQRARECWQEAWHLVGTEVEQVMSGGGAVWHPERLVPITRQGRMEDVWWSYGYSPIEDEEGIRGVLVLCNDVSEQRQQRENLRDSYRALFESMDEGFCVLDMLYDAQDHPVDFKIVEVNPAFENQSGLRDPVGKRIRDIVPELEHQWVEAYGLVAASGEPISFSQESPSLGRCFDVYAFRIGDASRRRVGALFRDITEKKRIEIERERFVALADSSNNFIGMADMHLKPFFINRAGLSMVGLDSMAQGMEKSVTDFFFEEDQAFILNAFFPRVMREGRGEIEIRMRHFKTSEAIWVLYNVFPIFEEHGKVIGYATVSQNITQRKKE